MTAIYGVDIVDLDELKHPFSALADTPGDWRSIFGKSLQSIRTFLAGHDASEVIAKCVNQAMANAAAKRQNPRWAEGVYDPYELIEPAELEILQALALMQLSRRKDIPASPEKHAAVLPRAPKVHIRLLEDAAATISQ